MTIISLTKLYPLTNSEIFFQPITVLYRTSLKHFTACRSDFGELIGTLNHFGVWCRRSICRVHRKTYTLILLTKLYPLRNSEIFVQPIAVLYRTSLNHFTACRSDFGELIGNLNHFAPPAAAAAPAPAPPPQHVTW